MPIYNTPKDTNTRLSQGDQARPAKAGLGFETALPSEFALERMGFRSETGGVQRYQAGSIFEAQPGEFVWLDNATVINPTEGNHAISVPGISGEGQGAFVAVVTTYITVANGELVTIKTIATESESTLDPANPADAAQDENIVGALEGGLENPEGGETKTAVNTADAQDKQVSADDPSTSDGVDEYQRDAYANSDFGYWDNPGTQDDYYSYQEGA